MVDLTHCSYCYQPFGDVGFEFATREQATFFEVDDFDPICVRCLNKRDEKAVQK